MPIPTAQDIELWLFEKGGWVSSKEICEHWDINERELRPRAGRSGFIDRFAIARSEGGYKHVTHATDAEFAAYRNGLVSARDSLGDRIDSITQARREGRRPVRHFIAVPTGQGLLI